MLWSEMVRDGRFLFRWRGYLPLLAVPVALAALRESAGFDTWLGETGEEIWVYACFLIAILGQSLRVHVVGHAPSGTSGRNTKAQRAETLNTTGFYSVCRHPLYFANFVVFSGILLAIQIWWLVLLGGFAYWIYYERIMAVEEEFLREKFGAAFDEWADRTPAFLPALSRWQRPDNRFSLRTVLRREPYGYFAIISSFLVMELVSDVVVEGDPLLQWLHTDRFWPDSFIAGAVAFLILRTLKKKTQLFSTAPADPPPDPV